MPRAGADATRRRHRGWRYPGDRYRRPGPEARGLRPGRLGRHYVAHAGGLARGRVGRGRSLTAALVSPSFSLRIRALGHRVSRARPPRSHASVELQAEGRPARHGETPRSAPVSTPQGDTPRPSRVYCKVWANGGRGSPDPRSGAKGGRRRSFLIAPCSTSRGCQLPRPKGRSLRLPGSASDG